MLSMGAIAGQSAAAMARARTPSNASPLAIGRCSRRGVRAAVLNVNSPGGKDNVAKVTIVDDLEIHGVVAPPEARQSAPEPTVASPSQQMAATGDAAVEEAAPSQASSSSLEDEFAARKAARARQQLTYQVSAIAASSGVTALAMAATYLRFQWHMEADGSVPWVEMMATLWLVAGGAFGMEMWARWAHKALWHEYEPGWALHKSHHEPRTGPFEANDIFAIINGVPAMALCAYGFVTPGIVGGMCFGSGLGISLFGIAYMFIHDGLVHRRFPVGPIADLPYMKQVAVAHQLHHSEKYDGAPWGMFLGPQELESIPGAKEDLDRLVETFDWSKR